MSELRDVILAVVQERAPIFGDTVKNLRTGLSFNAEIEPIDALIAQTELGEDYRDVVILHVLSNEDAAGINSQDFVQFSQFGVTVKFRIIKRRNNPTNPQADFWAYQWTEKDS